MTKMVKEFSFALGGIFTLCVYIAILFGWIDYTYWKDISIDWFLDNEELLFQIYPIILVILLVCAFIKIAFISYRMGQTVLVKCQGEGNTRLLFPISPKQTTAGSDKALFTETTSSTSAADQYEQIKERHHQELLMHEHVVLEAVKEYVNQIMTPYMKENDLYTLYTNIKNWQASKSIALYPTITNGKLSTLDLRHLAWNIGERLKWSGEERAIFIKQTFPTEFHDSDIPSIRRNLRQRGICIIEIDIPEKKDYHFHLKDL